MLWKPENDAVPSDASEEDEDILMPSVSSTAPAEEANSAAQAPAEPDATAPVSPAPVREASTAPPPKEPRTSFFHATMPAAQPKAISRAEVAAPEVQCNLSAGTTFVGDIDTTDSVVVAGKLEGHLTSAGAVRITGHILGDVEAKCIDLVGGEIEGNLTAVDTLNISAGGTVVGNLNGHEICLKAGTQVTGDVEGASVFMEAGAKLHGRLSIEEE